MKSQADVNRICPGCKRHCSADHLHCSRGKSYFRQETDQTIEKGRDNSSMKDETVLLMLRCGHLLHHGLSERAEKEDILQFLSADEKNELTMLLKKCLNSWE